jgi:hypothetical protein
MNFLCKVFTFLTLQKLRFGATFHFVTFLIGFFSVPFNLFFCNYFKQSELPNLLLFEGILFYTPAIFLSSFSKIERYFNVKFYRNNIFITNKLSFVEKSKYYFIVLFFTSTCINIPFIIYYVR